VLRLFAKLLLLSPLAALVAATNHAVDPGNLYRTGEEARIAAELRAGRPVETNFALDEMALVRWRVEGATRPDVLVLGSSRTMTLPPAAFPGRRFFSACVTLASIEDDIAIEQLFEDHGLRPGTLVLGLDPWSLTSPLRNPGSPLEGEFQRGLKRLGARASSGLGAPPSLRDPRFRHLQLLAPAYFRLSISTLITRWAGEDRARLLRPVDANILYPDGSFEWNPRMLARTPEQMRPAVAQFAAGAPAPLARPPEPRRVRLLESFLGALQAEGIQVVLFLPPYHPLAYRSLVSSGKALGILGVEDWARRFGASHGIQVVGSYDPEKAGAREEDFVDHHHLTRRASLRIFARGATLAAPGLDEEGPGAPD